MCKLKERAIRQEVKLEKKSSTVGGLKAILYNPSFVSRRGRVKDDLEHLNRKQNMKDSACHVMN